MVINHAETAVLRNSSGIFFCMKSHCIASKQAVQPPIIAKNNRTVIIFGKIEINNIDIPKNIVTK